MYRVAVGYAVIGWLIIQVAATIFPALEFPLASLKWIILAVLVGFPIALILAWAFDLGPHGFEKTAPAEGPAECPPALRPKRRNVYLLAVIGVVLAGLAGFFLLPRGSGGVRDKSVAVLPFDNFSNAAENAFFAEGLHDDVLTSLANIGELKVISRTSVMPYKGQNHNVREIAKALGVGSILEGSVRRSGNRIRLNVQLIDGRTDEHIWAEDYDRELTDVFAIQSELAQEIATRLKAKLSPAEKARMEEKPTENGEAYLLYVQAQAIATGADTERRKQAEALFAQAIQLDPSFALARANFSRLQSWIYQSIDPAQERQQKARAEAAAALRLRPHLPEAHLAQGFVHYYIEKDYAAALREFELAQAQMPNDANTLRAIAAIERRQGKWDESTKHYRRAISRSPTDAVLIENLGLNYIARHDYPAAAQTLDRALALAPEAFEIKAERAWVDFHWKEDFGRLHELFAATPGGDEPNPVASLARFNILFFERKFPEALAALERSPFENMRGETSAPLPKSFLAAQVYRAMGDAGKAQAAYEQARPIAERGIGESPGDAARYALLGLIDAGLGRNEEAIRNGTRAIELLPETVDAFDGPILKISLARIHAMVGNGEAALTLLEESATRPGGITRSELRFDPSWDPLRKEPRFQKLAALPR